MNRPNLFRKGREANSPASNFGEASREPATEIYGIANIGLEERAREARTVFGGFYGDSYPKEIFSQLYIAELASTDEAMKKVMYFSAKTSIDEYLSEMEMEIADSGIGNNLPESAGRMIDSYKNLASYCESRCGEFGKAPAK